MKFEVQYPMGSPHEVELQGTIAVLGRDPSCDLVLNNPKCSRRHAVLEAGPGGITIRDSGSANGVYVNGKRIDRAQLHEGDVVRLGEVHLRVLPEDMPGTLVMGPDDLREPPAPAASPPAVAAPQAVARPPAPAFPSRPVSPPAGRPSAPLQALRPPTAPTAARPIPRTDPGGALRSRLERESSRPTMVTLLVVLWAISGAAYPLFAVAGVLANAMGGLAATLTIALGLALALLAAILATGLWMLKPWARTLQIVVAAAGLVLCPATLASAVVLAYMLRSPARAVFSGRRVEELSALEQEEVRRLPGESGFALAMLGALFLGFAVTAGAYMLTRGSAPASSRPLEADVVERLRAVAAAEAAFRTGTCGGFSDLEGLLRPAGVIPNYPASGPAFLGQEFASPERAGYRFELEVSEPMASTEGCPRRQFRRYIYRATPAAAAGRHFLVASDSVVRSAEGRPALIADPPVPPR